MWPIQMLPGVGCTASGRKISAKSLQKHRPTFTLACVGLLGVSDWTLVSVVSRWTGRTFARVAALGVDTTLAVRADATSLPAFVDICARHDMTTHAAPTNCYGKAGTCEASRFDSQ